MGAADSVYPAAVLNDNNNIRPIAILSVYLLTCLTLTISIIRQLVQLYRRSKLRIPGTNATTTAPKGGRSTYTHIFLFITLAINSLMTTWVHMFSFFAYSYTNWANEHGVQSPYYPAKITSQPLQLGAWLHDTQLFKQAWLGVIETPERFWWSQQIFFFTAGWSLFLAFEGRGRKAAAGVKGLWRYMLLGQIVAISFAMNLSFLALCLGGEDATVSNGKVVEDSTSSAANLQRTDRPHRTLYAIPIVGTFVAVALIPYTIDTAWFYSVLLAPHILLFLPLIIDRIAPASLGVQKTSGATGDEDYAILYDGIVFAAGALQAKVTYQAVRVVGWTGIYHALFEHPAVSSVGWDVICCWMSVLVWQFGPDVL